MNSETSNTDSKTDYSRGLKPVVIVTEFNCYRSFLRACLRNHPVRRRPLSLNAWVKRLGYRSPRTIAMIMNGSRNPSDKLVEVLCADLQLFGVKKRYFELLIRKDRLTRRGGDVAAIGNEMQEIRHNTKAPALMSEQLERFASEWYVLVIHLMVAAPGFNEDSAEICKRLRRKVTPSQVRLAINDLLALGLLKRDRQSGKLVHTADRPLFSSTDIPRHAVRAHHRQMLQRANEALEEQSVDEREFMSTNIAVNRSDIPAIKAFMRETRDRFYKLFERSGREDIIQWNQQMFFHTLPCLKTRTRSNEVSLQ